MLVSVTCPRCRHVYPPGTMHICKGMGDRVRVKPIYDKPDPWASSLPQPEPERPRTLSYGPQTPAPNTPDADAIRARDPWARARGAASTAASLPTAASSEGKRQVVGAVAAKAAPKPSTDGLTVNGMFVDAETLATALHLLEKRRDQQRNYQKRKRSK